MTLAELIRKAIDIAVAGTDPDSNTLQKLVMEAESAAEQALDELSTEVAANPELRARLEKQFSVALTSGVGALPAGIIAEYLREGSVRDNDGNILQRVKYGNDFRNYLPTVYGYYHLSDNQILTRQINSGSLTDTATPLTIDAPFMPAKANLNTELPDELETVLVDILAVKIRGIVSRMPKPTQ